MNRFISSPRATNGQPRYSVLRGEGESTTSSQSAGEDEANLTDIHIGTEENETNEKIDVGDEKNSDHIPELRMSIRVLDLSGKVYIVECNGDWNVAQLKVAVAGESGTRVGLQRLIYRGNVMSDERTLEDYKLEDGCTIHLFARQDVPSTPAVPSPSTANSSSNVDSSEGAILSSGISQFPGSSHSAEGISGVVFPSDTLRTIDPLMLDTPLGNSARRVKLWSSFLLIVYTMKVLGQFALLAHLHAERESPGDSDRNDNPNSRGRYALPYYSRDPLFCVMELLINSFGVYVGCVGFKVAHGTNLHQVKVYCRGLVWLALMQIAEQIYITIQISQNDYPVDYIGIPASKTMREHQVTANILHTGILSIMWGLAIHHAICHKHQVMLHNETLPVAIVNPVPSSLSTVPT